eukprot:562924-Prorocentrum_minimum.AAC.1
MDADRLRAICLRWGVDDEVCRNATNPGFVDPFDVKHDITLDNPKYRFLGCHLMTGKLDWLLVHDLETLAHDMGNHDYRHSDHKWLLVAVRPRERQVAD